MTSPHNQIPDSHFDSLEKLEETYWWHLSRIRWAEYLIKNNFKNQSNLEALDYGCGTGGFLNMLAQRIQFKSRMGVDLSANAIGKAQRLGDCYYQIEPGDFRPARNKDLIFLMDMLEHVEQDAALLTGLYGEMKPKSALLISVPAIPALTSSWDTALGHFRRYTREQLKTRLSESGFRVEQLFYTFTYLVPAIWLRRVVFDAGHDQEVCEFPPVSSLTNKLLLGLNSLEMNLIPHSMRLFGSSLFCLARKE